MRAEKKNPAYDLRTVNHVTQPLSQVTSLRRGSNSSRCLGYYFQPCDDPTLFVLTNTTSFYIQDGWMDGVQLVVGLVGIPMEGGSRLKILQTDT